MNMITVILCSFILGIILTVLIQFMWFYKRFRSLPILENPTVEQFPPVKLPKILKEKLQDKEDLEKKQSCLWFNILSQYLFQELRDAQQVRRFVMKKMNKEFEEVLQTTSGKFLDQIIIRDINLGTTFPIVNNVSIKNIVKNGDKLEEIDLGLDVDYDGGFQIALDVFLVFNKSAFLSVTLKKLKGYARLQLTRTPYTHWSFSFYDDPEVDFAVESQFEGRQLPQVANIIVTQLRRSIRKKHTLPNYKMRFRPFFFQPELEKPIRDLTVNGHNITTGRLDIQVKECSRLLKTPKDSFLYCSLSIDYLPYKELVNSRRRVWVTHDIEVNKNNAQSVGLTFKEEQLLDRYETAVIVDLVLPDSPASVADIRKGDMLIAIGTTKISSTKQAAKLIKTAGEKFMVRLERTQIKMNPDLKFVEENVSVKEAAEFEFSEESAAGDNGGEEFISISFKQDGEEPKIKMSHDKPKAIVNQGPPIGHQKPRSKTSVSDLTGDGTPVLKKRNIGSESPASSFKRESSPHGLRSRTHSDPGQLTKLLNDDVDSVHSTETDGGTVSDSDDDVSTVQKTSEVKSSQNPKWNHAINFDITEQLRYLNLCVWCKIPEKTDKSEKVIKPERHLLVGHVNIPLSDICLECLLTLEGQTKYKVNLLPGEMKATASRSKTGKYMNLPGFDSQLCYGDVTLLVKFNNSTLNENERQTVTKVPLDTNVVTDSNRDTTVKTVDEVADINHHFNGAQFPSATYCNFCGKKIWLKVAFQCKQCSMICHKKCVEKCQADTLCTKDGVKCRDKPETEWKMPVVTSRLKKVQEYREGVTKSKLLSKFRKEDKSSPQQTPIKKNVPTSLDININTEGEMKMSPGLTPSPRFSPRLLRKVPKVVLEAGDSTTKVLQDDPASDDSDAEQNAALQVMYEKRAKGQNLDEMVVTAAKEMGRELFTHLSITERKLKLDHMVSKLQLEIDQETENKSELTRTLHETTDSTQRHNIEQHLLKSEEKGDALMMLLLHYCAGLQHCLDQEQEERLKNEGELNVEELEDCVEDIYVSTEDLHSKAMENGGGQLGDIIAALSDKSDGEESDSDDFDTFEKFRVLTHQTDDGEVI